MPDDDEFSWGHWMSDRLKDEKARLRAKGWTSSENKLDDIARRNILRPRRQTKEPRHD